MAWRCETFREIAPTHTTGRESTPGPQYRSQHPTQAHPPGPPTTPHPSQRAHLLLEKAPLQLPRRPRGPLWKAQVHEGSLCAAASRARQGAPSHRFRGTLELVWSTAPREHCRLRSFVHISSPASKPALRAPRRQCPRFAKIYLLDLPERDLTGGNISPLPTLAWYAPNKELRKSGRPDGKG